MRCDLARMPEDRLIVKNHEFKQCDVYGTWGSEEIIVSIDECVFFQCSFEGSTWKGVRFRKCTFKECSLSLVNFHGCEFLECGFESNHLSSKIQFRGTQIDAAAFIRLPYVCEDEEILKDKTPKRRLPKEYQRMRMAKTAAKVAFNILESVRRLADMDSYVIAVSTYNIAAKEAAVADYRYKRITASTALSVPMYFLEILSRLDWAFTRLTGLIGKWGASAVRPILVAVFLTIIFAGIYVFYGLHWQLAILKSINITTLVGYTAYFSGTNATRDTLLMTLHSLCAIYIYAVLASGLITSTTRRS